VQFCHAHLVLQFSDFTENFRIIAVTRSALLSSKCTTNCLADRLRLHLVMSPSCITGVGPPVGGGDEKGSEERGVGRRVREGGGWGGECFLRQLY